MRKIFKPAIAGLLIILISIGVYLIFFATPKIEGRYFCINDEEIYYDFTTEKNDNIDGKYAFPVYGTKGTWKISGDKVMLNDPSTGTHALTIYKKYLIDTENCYREEVPKENTFDATFTYNYDDEDNFKLIFKSDGTMYYDTSGEIASRGTYERNGDLFTFNINDRVSQVFVYQNKIYSNVFCKK